VGLPVDVLAGEPGEFRDAEPGVQERPNDELLLRGLAQALASRFASS
jgi:hypothetical protein